MYGTLKFLYNNLITAASMLTVSSQADGTVSGVKKEGDGAAVMVVYGDYQGAADRMYTVIIDSVASGVSVGDATFKWRTSDTTAGSYEESTVGTRTTPYYSLSADGAGANLSVSFTGVDGEDDFAADDQWTWIVRAVYGPERLLDRQRMTYWQSTGCAEETIVIDLGSAQAITAFVLHDHNLTDSANVTLQANSSDSWGSPAYSYTFSSVTDPLYLYLSQTYRYWRVKVEDAGNSDGYIQIGNLFLGTATTLAQANAAWGSTEAPGVVLQSNQAESGVMRRYVYATQTVLELNMGETVSNADVTALETMQAALLSENDTVEPLWVHLFSDSDDHLWLMDWENLGGWSRAYFRYLLNNGITMQLREVVKV